MVQFLCLSAASLPCTIVRQENAPLLVPSKFLPPQRLLFLSISCLPCFPNPAFSNPSLLNVSPTHNLADPLSIFYIFFLLKKSFQCGILLLWITTLSRIIS